MPRLTTSLTIPQPCHESWTAMSPTAAGRHCAACAKTVVDFTLATDAEILAYLARAAGGRTCGRFAAGQLERPLQRAAPAAPTARWRAWLAAAVALWAVREGLASEAKAQAATEWCARYWGGPVPEGPPLEAGVTPPVGVASAIIAVPVPFAAPQTFHGVPITHVYPELLPVMPLVLRGVVTDTTNNEGIPGVTVLLEGTQIGISTSATGSFEMTLPTEVAKGPVVHLVVSCLGYLTQKRTLAAQTAGRAQVFRMQADNRMMGELVVCQLAYGKMPPAPWHPRHFYYWGKYWLTRPFRRN